MQTSRENKRGLSVSIPGPSSVKLQYVQFRRWPGLKNRFRPSRTKGKAYLWTDGKTHYFRVKVSNIYNIIFHHE